MDFGGNHSASSDIASLMGWWQDAGVDLLVDDLPRNWLAATEAAPPPLAAPAEAPAPRAAPVPASQVFPDNLPDFQSWLATSDHIPMPLSARVAPMGDAASGLMILVDLPEDEDTRSGRLLSGPAGQLFDRMIAAIGHSRETLYLAAMAPGRPAGGYVDKAAGAMFGRLARHHIALAKPRALLLMGEQPSRIFLDLGFVEARGRTHAIDVAGTSLSAVSTFHPRTLLQHPEQKKRAWEDLQLFMKVVG